MNLPRQFLLSLLCLAFASAALAADKTTRPPEMTEDRPSPDVRILQDHDGDLVLALHRPWKSFSRPSVEVCLLPDSLPATAKIRPMYFVSNYLKGQVTADLYRSLDQADEVPVRHPFSEKGLEFEIIGNRNSLGKAAVCVACRTEAPAEVPAKFATGDPKDAKGLSRATFCLLDHWAVEQESLYLDLPENYFSAPGRLQIWLLRDNRIVWSDTIRWPGVASASKKKQEEKK